MLYWRFLTNYVVIFYTTTAFSKKFLFCKNRNTLLCSAWQKYQTSLVDYDLYRSNIIYLHIFIIVVYFYLYIFHILFLPYFILVLYKFVHTLCLKKF